MTVILYQKSLTANSTLRYAVGASNTTIECEVADASLFPSTTPFYVVLSPNDATKREVVLVSAISTQAMTVTRGSLSTTAVAHTAGEPMEVITGYQLDGSSVLPNTTEDDIIDFSSVTYVPGGSNGACLIRAGTYASPLTNSSASQSGLMRLYMETSADGSSYDRGIFVCLKTTGIKGIFPIAGLAEVLAQAGNGPTKVQASQFICHLNSATAKLAALGGDATAGMYGGWFKITANEGATTASGSRAAPIWLDNQLYGSNINAGMEEYTIFSTTGGSRPKAWAGFETTSSGWNNLFYFDETAYDQLPLVAADITANTPTYYLLCLINDTQYGIQLFALE